MTCWLPDNEAEPQNTSNSRTEQSIAYIPQLTSDKHVFKPSGTNQSDTHVTTNHPIKSTYQQTNQSKHHQINQPTTQPIKTRQQSHPWLSITSRNIAFTSCSEGSGATAGSYPLPPRPGPGSVSRGERPPPEEAPPFLPNLFFMVALSGQRAISRGVRLR